MRNSVRQAIESANMKFVEAFNRRDVASVAALYDENATVLPPNSQVLKGRRRIEEFWNGAIEMGVREVALKTIDVEHSGDLAYEIGAYNLKVQPKGGQATTDAGKYVVVWKRQADGAWKLAADIWNTDSPAA